MVVENIVATIYSGYEHHISWKKLPIFESFANNAKIYTDIECSFKQPVSDSEAALHITLYGALLLSLSKRKYGSR